MPKLLHGHHHSKVKGHVAETNVILVKQASVQHVPKAHFRGDGVDDATRAKRAKREAGAAAAVASKREANAMIDTFETNAAKGLKTIQVGAASARTGKIDFGREREIVEGQAAKLERELRGKEARAAAATASEKRDAAARDAVARKKITFRRSMAMRHGTVKWRRITQFVGPKGDDDRKRRDFLVLHFKKVGKNKLTLSRRDICKFFEKLNGVVPPYDALEYLRADDEGMTRENMREKIDDYNHYMKTRHSVRDRQRQYIAQFERYYRGSDDGDARRYVEKDVYKMVAHLTCESHPDEYAMIFAFRQVGGKDLDCNGRKLPLRDAAAFLEAYTDHRKSQRQEAKNRRGPIGHCLAMLCLDRTRKKEAGKYLL